MLVRREDTTRCSPSWLKLHQEYGLGRIVDNKNIVWSRDDLKKWQSLIDSARPAHEAVQGGADRTQIAQYTANEKLGNTSIQEKRLFCHAINSPLYLISGEHSVDANIEYRVDYQTIDLDSYSACLIIENQESFIYCHRFKWPILPKTLLLYRGHDKSAHALQSLLDKRKTSMDIYIFPDTDPAGLSIAISMAEATHIISPDINTLSPKASERNRFANQLERYPNLKSQSMGFSQEFQLLVTDVIRTGMAVSQEWLCAHNVQLTLVKL